MAKCKYRGTFPLLAEGYAREGLSDKQIAKKLGISEKTFYLYSNKYSEFSQAIKKGKAPVDVRVENCLLKRAEGYEYEEVTQEVKTDSTGKIFMKHVKKVKKQMPPDVTAQIFWLKNRKPDEWRDRQNVDVTSKGDKIEGFSINYIPAKDEE